MSVPGEGLEALRRFTGGDRGRADFLRRNLETIKQHADDPRVVAEIERVLRGETSVRALADSDVLASFRPPGLDEMAARFRAMTPEQRAALATEGRQALAAQAAEDGRAPGGPPTDDGPAEPFGPRSRDA